LLGTAVYQEANKRGSVAVATEAAKGMGKVTATRFAEAGLSVVTAEANIRATAANGADVIAVPTNVSDAYAVAHLAEPAFKAGEAARLMNKARPLDSLAGPGCGPAEPCALVPRTATTPRCGGVPEWSIGAVSKTVVPLAGTVGSNPTPSATPKLLGKTASANSLTLQ
jgi:hypothetical protein